MPQPTLQVSLHSRCLGISAGVVQPANLTMDGEFPDVNINQAVPVPPVDPLGVGLYLEKLLAALRLGQAVEQLLLHLVDVLRRVALAGQ